MMAHGTLSKSSLVLSGLFRVHRVRPAMPRPRRAQAGAQQFIDTSAQHGAAGDSDRAPRIRDAREARQYNSLQHVYANALAPYAMSSATVVRPQHVKVPAAGRRRKPKAKPVLGVVAAPVLPANIVVASVVRKPGKTKAEKARQAAARKVAAHRRAHPGPLAHAELVNAHKLVDQGVSPLTTCLYESKIAGENVRTANYNSRVVPIKRRTLKDGTLGKQHYRLASQCRTCHRNKSSRLRGDTPGTVTGGRLER